MASESKHGQQRQGAKAQATSARPSARRRGGIADMLSMDSERSARLLLFGAVALILAVSAAFIGFGYWYSEIRPEGRTVLKADGLEVSFSEMKRRMEYERALEPQYEAALSVLPEVAYLASLQDLTIISRAGELGVSVTAEDIDAALRLRLGVAADADQRAFADAFRDELDSTGLHEGEYRRIVEAELLGEKIREKFTAEAPATVEQAQVDQIGAANLEIAQQARQRVVAGEPWDVVARELSNETNVEETGGRQEFTPNGSLNAAYNDYAFEAEIGEISEPLSAFNNQPPFYIVRVVERSEQPLTEAQKPAYVQQQFDTWLSDTQAKMEIERNWDETDQREALNDILSDNPPVAPRPQQPAVQPTVIIATPAADATPAGGAGGPTAPAEDTAPDPSGAPQPDNGQ
jgi:hypothetical protein